MVARWSRRCRGGIILMEEGDGVVRLPGTAGWGRARYGGRAGVWRGRGAWILAALGW